MVSGPQSAVRASTVHIRQPSAHVVARNHGHVLDPKGLEDMFLEIGVKRQASCALQCDPCPVDIDLSSLTMCFMALDK